jgi:TorA maturation chaperone TorD
MTVRSEPIGLARLRQGLYRFIAAGLLPPDQERLAALASAIAVIEASLIDGFAFATWWRPLGAVLDDPPPIDVLETDYVRLFEAGMSEPPCPLVESAYLPLPRGPGALLVDLDREYRRFGLAANPLVSLPADHAVPQLEAMAALCAREDEATDRGDVAEARRVLGEEERFLERHLARWFPVMARRGAMVAGDAFYRTLLTAGRAFVHHDRDLVATLAGDHRLEAVR